MTTPRYNTRSSRRQPVATPSTSLRAVWVALLLLAGAFVGAVAGLVAYIGGADGPAAILTAGGSAGGAIALLLGLLRYVDRTP